MIDSENCFARYDINYYFAKRAIVIGKQFFKKAGLYVWYVGAMVGVGG